MTKLIAEFCQNHLGDPKILDEMISAAAESGAQFGKIQSIWVKNLTQREAFELGKVNEAGETVTIKRPYQPEYDRLKELELSLSQHEWFIKQASAKGLTPLTTIFARGDIDSVAKLNWPNRYVKVASYDCASYPFLAELKNKFSHLFVSTGAMRNEEIQKAADVLAGHDVTFFHCVTKYPNALADCHLNRLEFLRKFSKSVGWSDHSNPAKTGLKASMAAMALGVDFIERHFTILPPEKTKDGVVSVNPAQMKELVAFSKLSMEDRRREVNAFGADWEQMMGSASRELTAEELRNRDYYRGRFATMVDGKPIYNWEEKQI